MSERADLVSRLREEHPVPLVGSGFLGVEMPELKWQAAAFPFASCASKNQMWGRGRYGQVYLRPDAKKLRQAITDRISHLGPWFETKTWLWIMVQKPSHKSDPVNVLDLVCDAVKDGMGIDDRWFALARLDWEVNPVAPQLFVAVGQQHAYHEVICSNCGEAKSATTEFFGANASSKFGVSRECRRCVALLRTLRAG